MDSNSSINPLYFEQQSQIGIKDYICCFCHLVPNPETAIEDENCGQLFCDICIKIWKSKNNACPVCNLKLSMKKLKNTNIKKYNNILNLVIICQEENCKWEGKIKDYYAHLNNFHKKSISNTSTKFELYKYYQASIHNHALKYLDTTMDNGWSCDGQKINGGCLLGLNNINKSKNIKRFRCEQCNYDLCEKCMMKYYDDKWKIKNDNSNNRSFYLFEKKYYSNVHPHPLIFLDKSHDNGWSCDIKQCLSGAADDFQSYGLPRFRCAKCDFDLCENCMNYYRKKNFYELNKSYKLKNHEHPLVYLGMSKNDDGWECYGKYLNERICFSGNIDFNQMKGFERFKCNDCNFNLCRYCMDFYLNCNIKDDKFYN